MNDESPPTLQPLDAEGDKLMEMAQQFDETGQLPKEKTWQQIEAEKASVRAEEARIEQEKASIEAEKARNFLQSMPRARHNGFTADEYANASRSFTQEAIKAYKDGDTDK